MHFVNILTMTTRRCVYKVVLFFNNCTTDAGFT